MDRRRKMDTDKESEKGAIAPDDVLRRMLKTPPVKKKQGKKKKPG